MSKANVSVLKINGVEIITPMDIEFQIYDLDGEDGSGRDQAGNMFRDRRNVKRKLVCKFPPMTQSQMSTLLNQVSPVFISLEYPDAMTGGQRVMTCYVGDRTTPIYRIDPFTKKWIYEGISINFIEK